MPIEPVRGHPVPNEDWHDAAQYEHTAARVHQELAALPGLGERTAQWLVAIGITSVAELERRLDAEDGALQVYRDLQASRPGVSLNGLRVLEALRLGCDWRDVPKRRMDELRRELARRDGR